MLADRNGVPFPPIRRLGPEDLKHCVALSIDRGWSPEEAKWALLLEETEAFGVDAPDGGDGGLAGSVVLARYGPDLASVGMMLVQGRYARRGLGHALMTHLLAQAGNATVTLFATDAGKPLYAKLGFRVVRGSVAFVGGFRQTVPGNGGRSGTGTDTGTGTRPATDADMPAILAVDRAAFGADRGYLLRRLPAFAERLHVIEAADGVTGFAAAWRNGPNAIIGPVVAASGADARRLITDLAAQVRGPVRLDLDPDRPELPEWARNRGLEPVSGTAVMAHGDWSGRGEPSRLFTPISVALALVPEILVPRTMIPISFRTYSMISLCYKKCLRDESLAWRLSAGFGGVAAAVREGTLTIFVENSRSIILYGVAGSHRIALVLDQRLRLCEPVGNSEPAAVICANRSRFLLNL